jgi:predicted lipoprotein with Yx(FWY)xxD motif
MPNKTVKNLTLVVAVLTLASAFAMAQAAELQTAGVQSLTGTVTCEGRITHLYTCQKNQPQQACTLACVDQGSKFVLMVGDKSYLLHGDSRELRAYAGGKATVIGIALNDKQIDVQTASSAKHNMPGQSVPSSMGANTAKNSDNSQGTTE